MANKAVQMARENRDWAQGTGNDIMTRYGGQAEDFRNQGRFYGDRAGDKYLDMIEHGGYTPDQANRIVNMSGEENVPGLNDLSHVSQQEGDRNFLTPEEQQKIQGDPMKYLHSDTMGQYMQEGNEKQNAAVGRERSDLNSAIDPSQLRVSGRYGDDVASWVGNTGSKLDEITGDKGLGLSENFNSKYEMTPEQQQQIVSQAGEDVSKANQASQEDVERRLNASGVGPVGAAGRQARYGRMAAQDATSASNKARIATDAERANRVKTAEQMRLDAAKGQAGMRVNATQYTGDRALDALGDIETRRNAGERDISDRYMQAATEAGRNAINTAGQQTDRNINTVANVRDAELGAENRQATRYGQVAGNRQQTQQQNSQENYNRGAAANNAVSNRYGQVYNNRQTQQQAGAQGAERQQEAANTNYNQNANRQLQGFATTGGLSSEAASTTSGAQAQPGIGTKILNGVLGGASAAANFIEDGRLITEPTEAIIGENGPEAVVPLDESQVPPPRDYAAEGAAMQSPRYGEMMQKQLQPRPSNGYADGWRGAVQKIGTVAGGVQQGIDDPHVKPRFKSRYGSYRAAA